MNIDFSSSDVFMPQNFLKCTNIHIPVQVHQSGSRMSEFMWRISADVQPGDRQVFFHEVLDGRAAHTALPFAQE